jgi:acyl transferase domain-containing protein
MNENGGNDMLDADGAADENGFEVAVIGMAGRFPGATNVNQFWENLCNGVESISTFTDDEVLASGLDPDLLRHPDFVPALGLLEGIEMFDAAFFKYSPREAKTMAPQHRVMLECAYEALQHAGYDAQRYAGAIGVFAGESANSYTRPRQFENSSNKDLFYSMHAGMGNDRDFLSTTVSYKLNLRGPSLTIQTACSTSLATVHMAYQSLLSGECDIALAGGIALRMPPKAGYIYQKEGILSPDGHCRAFDASAQGTVGGEGVGMVTLKRLEDALADGDCIHAVIKGSALNNDGSLKVGFTAPGIDGQADVIARAQAMAEIDPETISYIEKKAGI